MIYPLAARFTYTLGSMTQIIDVVQSVLNTPRIASQETYNESKKYSRYCSCGYFTSQRKSLPKIFLSAFNFSVQLV